MGGGEYSANSIGEFAKYHHQIDELETEWYNEWRSMASIVKKKVTGSTSISATFNLFDYMHLDGEAHREFFANIGGRG